MDRGPPECDDLRPPAAGMCVRTLGQMGSADPLEKMDEKLKSENMQKEHFSGLQNAPFRSQIFKNFFASGSKGALTPLTKILRTFLAAESVAVCGSDVCGAWRVKGGAKSAIS